MGASQAELPHGCDFIDVSSGGPSPEQKFDIGPGYQAALAAEVRRQSGLATIAVALVTDSHEAEHILRSGQTDMVAHALSCSIRIGPARRRGNSASTRRRHRNTAAGS